MSRWRFNAAQYARNIGARSFARALIDIPRIYKREAEEKCGFNFTLDNAHSAGNNMQSRVYSCAMIFTGIPLCCNDFNIASSLSGDEREIETHSAGNFPFEPLLFFTFTRAPCPLHAAHQCNLASRLSIRLARARVQLYSLAAVYGKSLRARTRFQT